MPTLFVGNFDFEHELAGAQPGSLPGGLRRINDELAFAWLAVASDGDAILGPTDVEAGFLEAAAHAGLPRVSLIARDADIAGALIRLAPLAEWRLQPWGWSESASRLARRVGLPESAVGTESIRQANSRRFSSELEREWGVGLEGAGEVRSIDELADVLSSLSIEARWVVKAEFGMSARERILGTGRSLTETSASWVRKRLARDGAVFFEPWVERLDEAGLQLEVPAAGEPILVGITSLLTDSSGGYCGSRFEVNDRLNEVYAPAVDVALQAAKRLQQVGYRGPLGIDAMRYRRSDGSWGLRPLQDINARLTMGRLSLSLRRFLAPGETGVWCHVRWNRDATRTPSQWFDAFVSALPAGARCLRMSPFEVNGTPTQLGMMGIFGLTSYVAVESSMLR